MRLIHFGAAGWRARYDDGFDDEGVIRVADALGRLWATSHLGATVLVGYDTRFEASRFAQLAASVIASHDLRVKVSKGPCPIPAVSWCAAHDDACVGVLMLTASGYSCEYGGMLVRGSDGGAVSPAFLSELDRTIGADATQNRGPIEFIDVVSPYLENYQEGIDCESLRSARLRVVVDPMFGAAIHTVNPLMELLGCDATFIHNDISPDFGGLHPVPDEPWADDCERAVVSTGADCGIVLDCDADRATLIDEKGRLVSRHDLVTMLIRHLIKNRGAHGRVVVTSATSMRAQWQAQDLGCPTTVVPIGFNRIYEEILEGDVLLAAEEFGGVCVPQHLFERDGIFACVLGLEMMAKEGKKLSDLVGEQKERYGNLIYMERDVRLDGASLQSLANLLPGMNPATVAGRKPLYVSHADGVRLQFDDGAWVQLRVSRTESVARVYAEANGHQKCDDLVRAALALARGPRPGAQVV